MTLPLEATPGAVWLSRWETGLNTGQKTGLSPTLQEVVGTLRESAPQSYLVGGSVRDLLLGRPTRDLDILLLGPVKPPGKTLAQTFGADLTSHDTFLTCSLTFPNGNTLDMSQARLERYPHPGALPSVVPSDLAHDLYRRDFSVNALALSLSAPHELIGVRGARENLEAKTLRILHERSFLDDPTRIVRGARLAARLDFTFEDRTANALHDALEEGAGAWVSPARRKNELLLCLEERAVAPVISTLNDVGALRAFYGLEDALLLAELDALRDTHAVPLESYLLALLLPLSADGAAAFVRTFGFPQRLLAARSRVLKKEPPRTVPEAPLTHLLYAGVAPLHPPVRGSDVISLGLPAGPEVGTVLRELGQARVSGKVASFADELELAKRLVFKTLQEQT